MLAVVTGGAGFIGGALVRQLRARGDQVRALVRDPSTARGLREAGCEVVGADLAAEPVDVLAQAFSGADVAFHLAGSYRIGIRRRERAAMYAANVTAAESVLDAAIADVPRIVYVSTANAFGNTHGRVVDEEYRRPDPPDYLSWYDRTKHLAHLAAERRAAAGAPLVIAMPTLVYGPGDHSQAGAMIQAAMGGRLPAVSVPDLGGSFVHVEDVATGLLLAAERGRAGASYILGGEIARMGDVIRRAAAIGGHRPPRVTVPGWLLGAAGRLGGAIGPALGGPDLGELVRASQGVTYWASHERAARELGYAPRDLDAGLRTLLEVPPPH